MENTVASRRSFLKGAVGTACGMTALAALTSCAPTKRTSEKEVLGQTGEDATAQSSYVEGYYSQIDWLGSRPQIEEADITTSDSYDIVVLGSGWAGSQVALAAAEEGLSVAVVEMQPEDTFGENGSEIGVFNSNYLMEHYGLEEADLAEVTDEFVKANAGLVNPTIIKKYVDNSGAMMDHLIETIQEGAYADILDDDAAFVHLGVNADGTQKTTGYPIVQSGSKVWAGTLMFKIPQNDTPDQHDGRRHNGLLVVKSVIEKAISLGATYYWGHEAVVLDQAEDGTVTGVVAKSEEGALVRLNASKGVAVCCGDYGSNPAMVSSLMPELVEWNLRNGMSWEEAQASLMGASGRTGTGHKMCCWAGGFIEEAPRAVQQNGTVGTEQADIPTGPFGAASFLELNKNGERFFNESDYYAARGATARQPKGTIAFVTDTQYFDQAKECELFHGGPNFGRQVFIDNMFADWEAAAKTSGEHEVQCCSIGFAGKSTIFSANSLEELAGYLGYEGAAAETFIASVERYNELCRKGHDDDFFKDANHLIAIDQPPFFGWTGYNMGAVHMGLVTMSGMVTNHDFQVLDANLEPIKGLYVAGNCLGGRYAISYATPVAGNSLGMALTHGRLLGKHLASL